MDWGKSGGSFRIDLGKLYKGWQAGWDRAQEETRGDLLGGVHGLVLGLGGAAKAGILGHDPVYGRQINPTIYNPNPDKGPPTLKTHVAGQANNFGRYGDISQQAPGGWIRQQQKNRYGRASTILTRGTSRKTLLNKKKS